MTTPHTPHLTARPPVVFVCAPLGGDVAGNIARAKVYARIVHSLGMLPLVPHLAIAGYLDDNDPRQRAEGMALCYHLLAMSDALAQFEDATTGMKGEIERSHADGRPIARFYPPHPWATWRSYLESVADHMPTHDPVPAGWTMQVVEPSVADEPAQQLRDATPNRPPINGGALLGWTLAMLDDLDFADDCMTGEFGTCTADKVANEDKKRRRRESLALLVGRPAVTFTSERHDDAKGAACECPECRMAWFAANACPTCNGEGLRPGVDAPGGTCCTVVEGQV